MSKTRKRKRLCAAIIRLILLHIPPKFFYTNKAWATTGPAPNSAINAANDTYCWTTLDLTVAKHWLALRRLKLDTMNGSSFCVYSIAVGILVLFVH